jgi:hypothetical protein
MGSRKLHNEDIHNLYSSPNLIAMIKSKIMRCGGYVARIVAKMSAYRGLVGKSEGKGPWEDLDVCRRIILKWVSVQ